MVHLDPLGLGASKRRPCFPFSILSICAWRRCILYLRSPGWAMLWCSHLFRCQLAVKAQNRWIYTRILSLGWHWIYSLNFYRWSSPASEPLWAGSSSIKSPHRSTTGLASRVLLHILIRRIVEVSKYAEVDYRASRTLCHRLQAVHFPASQPVDC